MSTLPLAERIQLMHDVTDELLHILDVTLAGMPAADKIAILNASLVLLGIGKRTN